MLRSPLKITLNFLILAGLAGAIAYLWDLNRSLNRDLNLLQEEDQSKALIQETINKTIAFNNAVNRHLIYPEDESYALIERQSDSLLALSTRLRTQVELPASVPNLDSVHLLLAQSIATFQAILRNREEQEELPRWTPNPPAKKTKLAVLAKPPPQAKNPPSQDSLPSPRPRALASGNDREEQELEQLDFLGKIWRKSRQIFQEAKDFVKKNAELDSASAPAPLPLPSSADEVSDSLPAQRTSSATAPDPDSLRAVATPPPSQVQRRQRLMEDYQTQSLRLFQLENEIVEDYLAVLEFIQNEEREEWESQKQQVREQVDQGIAGLIRALAIAGIILLLSLSIINIEELRLNRLQKRLKISQKRREELWQTKEKYLLFLSHELRSPLNIISAYAKLLHRREASEETLVIKKTSDELVNMVSETLQLKKLQEGKIEIQEQSLLLSYELYQWLLAFRPEIAKKGIELHTDIPKSMQHYRFDFNKLRQIVVNLVNNALKHSEARRLSLSLQSQALDESREAFCICIEDDGKGISTAKQRQLFQPFLSAEADSQSSGLGLSISRELVQILGGQLKLHSGPAGGTKIELHFEAALAQAKEEPAEKPQESPKLQVPLLLVDDEQFMGEILSYFDPRSMMHYAQNLSQAQQALRGQKFQVLVLDYHLGPENGLDLLDWLEKENYAPTPKIILSSADESLGDREDLQGRYDRFLLKPYDFENLVREINQLGQGPQLHYDLRNFRVFAQNDESELARLLALFCANFEQDLRAMERHLQMEEFAPTRELAHKLKNTLGQLEARELLALIELILYGKGDDKQWVATTRQFIQWSYRLVGKLRLQASNP